MRRTGILTGGISSLLPFATACLSPSHSSSPQSMSVTPTTVHTSFERGELGLCGVWLNERHEVIRGDQASVLTEQAPSYLLIMGLMVDTGSIIIDERSRIVIGQSAGNAGILKYNETVTATQREGLNRKNHQIVTSWTASFSAAVPTTSTH